MVFINLQGAQIRFSRTPPTGSADEPYVEAMTSWGTIPGLSLES